MSKFLNIEINYLKNDLSNINATGSLSINTIIENNLLDVNRKIKTDLIPSIAISSIFVVQTIIDRNNLQNIETGDVVKVIENDKIYMYDSNAFIEINSNFIESLGDVQFTNLTHGDVLKYDSSDSKWRNSQLQLNNNTDVQIDNLNLFNNNVLMYDSTDLKWKNKNFEVRSQIIFSTH